MRPIFILIFLLHSISSSFITDVLSRCPELAGLCGGTAFLNPQAGRECVEKALRGEDVDANLSSECKTYLGEAINEINDRVNDGGNNNGEKGPRDKAVGCFHDVGKYCSPSQQASIQTMNQCLEDNYEVISDECRDAIDHKRQNEKNRIPGHFLQSENKTVTQLISAVSILALLVPLLLSGFLFKKSMGIKKKMIERIEIEMNTGTPAPGVGGVGKKSRSPTQSAGISLSFFNIDYHINNKRILQNISAHFTPGLNAIMGPSGSGKTTFLNLISGHTTQGSFSGSRIVNGRPFDKEDFDSIVRRMGYVEQQDTQLFETLTVYENLSFASLLRMPKCVSVEEKIDRAITVMGQVGLLEVANSKVGGQTFKGISGGQRRRLSIALELLNEPELLLADEPTSGLDTTVSLSLLKNLKEVATRESKTIITTIHQPRADIFNLFSNIVLLGKGGFLIYCGPAKNAAAYLNQHVDLDMNEFDNKADFVMDAIGLKVKSGNEEQELYAMPSSRKISALRFPTPANWRGAKTGRGEKTRGEYEMVAMENGDDIEAVSVVDLADEVILGDATTKTITIPATNHCNTAHLAKAFKRSPEYRGLLEQIREICLRKNKRREYFREGDALPLYEQTLFLFTRRYTRLNKNFTETVKQWLAILFTGWVLAFAFSYTPSSNLQKPYLTFMMIYLISSVAFIFEYLILVPEYFDEKKVMLAETMRCVTNNRCYVLACSLTEVPRSILHCSLLLSVCYALHDLNPDVSNILFCWSCLMCGSISWQSVICFCSSIFTEMHHAYNLLFIFLGGGTLFGGLLIAKDDINPLFLPIYYTSVTAVTQRALIVNDFLCCYLTSSCVRSQDLLVVATLRNFTGPSIPAGISLDDDVCPGALAYAGDGTDEGNLGRMMLGLMGLNDVDPFVELLTVFCTAVGARLGSIGLLRYMQQAKENLVEINGEVSDAKLRSLVRVRGINNLELEDEDEDEAETQQQEM